MTKDYENSHFNSPNYRFAYGELYMMVMIEYVFMFKMVKKI